MKNNYSIVQRNALVEDHLWCIKLALRLIKAVAGYDPDKGALQQHIFAQFKYELLDCKAAYRLCGITDAPKKFRKGNIISLDSITGDSEMCEQTKVA